MKTIQTNAAQAVAISAIVDQALGYPLRCQHVGPGSHPVVQPTWDGTGPTPIGWSKSHLERFPLTANAIADVWLPMDDATLAAVQASALVTPAQIATVVTASAARVDVADLSVARARVPQANPDAPPTS